MESNKPLVEYLRILWRWAWLFLLVGIVGGLLGFGISSVQRPIYAASTTLLIDEAPGQSASSEYQAILTSERRTRTYAQLLTTTPLLDAVIKKLGLAASVEELKRSVSVQSARDTQLIKVQVGDPDARRAAEIANALVTIFADQARQLHATRYVASQENLQQQMQILEQEIVRTEKALDGLAASPTNGNARDRLETTLAQYRQSYANLLQSYEQVRLAEAQTISSIVQVEPAIAPRSPASPRMLQNAGIGTMLGLLLVACFAFIRETLDESVRDAETLSEQTGLPVLGSIPHAGISAVSSPLVIIQPFSKAAEAIRALRTNLQATSASGAIRSVLITSPTPNDGKSFVALNLAAALAQSGLRVVLIDADLRRPTLHERLELGNSGGLSMILRQQRIDLDGHLKPTSIAGLAVITAGSSPTNPSELVGSSTMVQLIRHLEEEWDVVLIDAPPVTVVTDAAVLAPHVQSVLFVVRSKSTMLRLSRHALEQLRHVGARVVGTVITDARSGLADTYKGYYPSAKQGDGTKAAADLPSIHALAPTVGKGNGAQDSSTRLS